MTTKSDEIDALGIELHTNALRSLGDIRDFIPRPAVEDVVNLAAYVDFHDNRPEGNQPLYQDCRTTLEAVIAVATATHNGEILALGAKSRFVHDASAIYSENLANTGSLIGLVRNTPR